MIKRIISCSKWIILLAAAMILSSCGDESSDAPLGSTITFSSGDISYEINADPGVYFDEYISIFVKNEEGLPLKNVELKISYPWAVPNAGNVQFYDGGSAVDSPMTVRTDEDGAYELHFQYFGGMYEADYIEYTGDISVVSGSASGSIEFKVEGPSEE